MAILVDRRAVFFDAKRRFVGPAVVAVAFETKKQLAVGYFFDFGRAGAKGCFQIFFKQIVGFAHVAVDIDDPNAILCHGYLRSRKTSSTAAQVSRKTNDFDDTAMRIFSGARSAARAIAGASSKLQPSKLAVPINIFTGVYPGTPKNASDG